MGYVMLANCVWHTNEIFKGVVDFFLKNIHSKQGGNFSKMDQKKEVSQMGIPLIW